MFKKIGKLFLFKNINNIQKALYFLLTLKYLNKWIIKDIKINLIYKILYLIGYIFYLVMIYKYLLIRLF